jgi:predicted transport protein
LSLLGVRLIASEYPIPNGRIDTLGLDEDDIPVIIEYKKKKDLSAIVQGLFYLDWIMQNKKPFGSIVKDKLGKNVNVNWSKQPRLLIIAQDFDVKELTAINQMGPRIELIKYSFYEGLFNIDGVNIVDSKSPPKKDGEEKPSEDYTVEQLVKKATPEIQSLYMELREKITGISESVWEKVHSYYCDFRTTSTFTSVTVQKNQLKIFLKMGEREVDDPKGLTKPVPSSWGYGHLNTQFIISKTDEIDDAMHLIMQAYDYVSG